ncbi:MAG: hypothetical protein JXJ04_01125 [Spirochaetales bacterium]|nr:hypothetical protein [Spirochaetales bacterium]
MDENIKKHNIIERKIKYDIVMKNTLRKQLTGEIRKVVVWAEQLKTAVSRRKRKRYVKNIERYVPIITKNKKIVLDLINKLETRITTELKYSEKEIADLKQNYKKEYDEMLAARKVLIKAKQGTLSEKEIEEIAGLSIADMVTENENPGDEGKKKVVIPKEVLLAKARKKLNKEAKDVQKVEKEIDSEEKDTVIFKNEIKRMIFEREILS